MPEVLLYQKRGKIAYITLNRPEVLNAINNEMGERLTDVLLSIRDDADVWAAIITGAGKRAFSAGADLKEVDKRTTGSERERLTLMRGLGIYKPFIAAINGYCLGGGLELALECDIRVAAEHATFGLPEVTLAGFPAGGGTQRLPEILPLNIALEIILTGDRITAQEAYRIGLVNRVVPMAELLPTAEVIANRINKNGPLAVRAIKEAVCRGIKMPYDQGLRLEALLSNAVRLTEDAKEGPRAFVEKRVPVYKGK